MLIISKFGGFLIKIYLFFIGIYGILLINLINIIIVYNLGSRYIVYLIFFIV